MKNVSIEHKYCSVRKSVSRIDILVGNIMLIFYVTITLKSYPYLISVCSVPYAPLLYFWEVFFWEVGQGCSVPSKAQDCLIPSYNLLYLTLNQCGCGRNFKLML